MEIQLSGTAHYIRPEEGEQMKNLKEQCDIIEKHALKEQERMKL
jgi:hypothetical protein